MISKAIRSAAAAVIIMSGCALPSHGRAQTAIGVSYQPSLYWALPFHYANVKGWWKEVGLVPNFSTFPAGAPQYSRARVFGTVDAVAEAHQPVAAVERV